MKVKVLIQTPQQIKLRFQLPEAIQDPAARLDAMQAAVRQVLAERQINPSREPRLTPTPGAGLVFTCELDLYPAVTLPADLSVTLEVPPLAIPDQSELMAALEALQIRLGETIPATGPVSWGQLLSLDMIGFVRGEPIPMSVQHALPLLLKQDAPQAALMAELIGMQPGETRIVKQAMPVDYPYAPWRKVMAEYHVLVLQASNLSHGLRCRSKPR
jgi:FKBP-type peptidyl-prolyl cis-trans isomerase (trigger factor)